MRWFGRRDEDGGWGMDIASVDALGRYNAERARGVAHTPEWQAQMAELQERFNVAQRARWEREGTYVGEGWGS